MTLTAPKVAVRGNVLVVEDDSDCGNVIVQLLSMEGYRVKLARSRDLALLAIRQHRYDILILDVVMPGMSIQEFIEKIPSTIAGRIILISAIVDPKETAESLRVKTWLKKPFEPDLLIESINRMAGRVQSQ